MHLILDKFFFRHRLQSYHCHKTRLSEKSLPWAQFSHFRLFCRHLLLGRRGGHRHRVVLLQQLWITWTSLIQLLPQMVCQRWSQPLPLHLPLPNLAVNVIHNHLGKIISAYIYLFAYHKSFSKPFEPLTSTILIPKLCFFEFLINPLQKALNKDDETWKEQTKGVHDNNYGDVFMTRGRKKRG